MVESLASEEDILRCLKTDTGLEFRKIGGIATRDRDVARLVLPWVIPRMKSIAHKNLRHALYALFDTPHASRYLEQLIEWWRLEHDELASGTLTWILSRLVKGKVCLALWEEVQSTPQRPFHYDLLARLAKEPVLTPKIADHLLNVLQSNSTLTYSELQAIAKVPDIRIRAWFEAMEQAHGAGRRNIANLVPGSARPLPKGMRYAPGAPNRNEELYSAEVDLNLVDSALADASEKLGTALPFALAKGVDISCAEIDRWIVAPTFKSPRGPLAFWFRLEDVDAVEIVVTKKAR